MSQVSPQIFEAFSKMKAKDFGAAENILRQGLQASEKNPSEQALFYSSLGVLFKMKGDYKEAWRLYEKAEKLLPTDPSLKLITAKLLIDHFSQYDLAIKKLKEVLKIAKGSASYEHQAHATLAMAYLKKGDKKKAVEMLDLSMGPDFDKITSSYNLNFEVIGTFVARSFEMERCRDYVEKSLTLAKLRKEDRNIQFLTKLLDSFEPTLH